MQICLLKSVEMQIWS